MQVLVLWFHPQELDLVVSPSFMTVEMQINYFSNTDEVKLLIDSQVVIEVEAVD